MGSRKLLEAQPSCLGYSSPLQLLVHPLALGHPRGFAKYICTYVIDVWLVSYVTDTGLCYCVWAQWRREW